MRRLSVVNIVILLIALPITSHETPSRAFSGRDFRVWRDARSFVLGFRVLRFRALGFRVLGF